MAQSERTARLTTVFDPSRPSLPKKWRKFRQGDSVQVNDQAGVSADGVIDGVDVDGTYIWVRLDDGQGRRLSISRMA